MDKRKCPYNDKEGNALQEGDKLVGSTNFDRCQGYVSYDEAGKDDFEKWKITIEYHLQEYPKPKWIAVFPYTLYLAYHESNGNCIYYKKIENYIK